MKGSLFLVLIAAVALSLNTGCSEDEVTVQPQPQQNVLQLAVANSDLDVLEAAAVRAGSGVTNVLSGSTQITVFAPTDAAFVRYLGVADEAAAIATINTLPSSAVADILTYHVIAGTEIKAASVPAGPNAEVTTARAGNNNRAFVTRSGNNVSINGARVAIADVDASNGVVHVIDQVLAPPVGNIVETATDPTYAANFNILVAALQRAQLVDALSGTGPFTVFAPTDDAFLATLRTILNNPTLTEAEAITTINGLDVNSPLVAGNSNSTLLRILQYHVAQGRSFSALLTAGNVNTLLSGSSVAIGLPTGGVTVTGTGNDGVASNVVLRFANVTTTNGVIHVIDRVLIPAQ